MSRPRPTIAIELPVGEETAAIATLLNRQIYAIRPNKLADWYKYADIAEKFVRGIDQEIFAEMIRDARRIAPPKAS